MDRQLNLDLTTDAERVAELVEYLRPIQLAPRLVSAIALMFGRGDKIQVLGEPAIRWSGSKAAADRCAKDLGLSDCSGNTFLAACEELERMRVIGILRVTRPWTYALSLRALGRLSPPTADPLAGLPIFGGTDADRGEDRSASVSVGQPPRVRETREITNPCLESGSVSRVSGAGGLADRLRRPWDRRAGLTGEDLVQAVAGGDLEPLRRLWREAKVLEWVGGSDDDLLRFLTACHHVATVTGLANRMSALVARVKRGIDVGGTRHASEKWAARVLRGRHVDPALRAVGRTCADDEE